MASVAQDKNGFRRVLFVHPLNNERKGIRVGKLNKSQANTVKGFVEDLVASVGGIAACQPATVTWVNNLSDVFYRKLVKVGLLLPRAGDVKPEVVVTGPTLKEFVAGYITGRSDVKPNTLRNLKAAQKELDAYFGDRLITDITAGDAEEFWRHLLNDKKAGGRGLGQNTARRICGRAKQVLRFAIKKKLVTDNPFADVESHVRGNKDRRFFITREMADKVLDQCPSTEWKLIFALSRYGGLRCPSETLALKWGDIDFGNSRIRVPSPKTEHIEGKDSRMIPMFPELRDILLTAFSEAGEGAEHVITRYRDKTANLRTQLVRIIQAAGLTPWPKLFHNLRSTRQTELSETYPSHVACEWIGNSEDVAQEHYLQVLDQHFAKAIDGGADSRTHQRTQQGRESVGMAGKSAEDRKQKTPEITVNLGESGVKGYPQGESNPCMQTENLLS